MGAKMDRTIEVREITTLAHLGEPYASMPWYVIELTHTPGKLTTEIALGRYATKAEASAMAAVVSILGPELSYSKR